MDTTTNILDYYRQELETLKGRLKILEAGLMKMETSTDGKDWVDVSTVELDYTRTKIADLELLLAS